MLLLESGKVVSVSRLVDAAWDEEPPPTAGHQVRKAVAELRKRIPHGGELISTEGSGYRLVLGGRELDVERFAASVRLGKAELEAGRTADGRSALTSALDLWRGPVLLGSGGRRIDEYAAAFEEQRLEAAERLIDARLELGELDELVGYIRRLIAEQPLREGLRLRLMRTLRQTGRPAEALVEYQRTMLPSTSKPAVREPAETLERHRVFADRRYVAMTSLATVLTLQAQVLSFAVPLWITEHTKAPRLLVAVVVIINTAFVVLFQTRAARGTEDTSRSARLCRRSGLALLASCAVIAPTAHMAATGATLLLLAFAILLSLAEVWFSAGTFSLSFNLAPDGAHGQYQGFFSLARGISAAVAPALLSALCLRGATTGWLWLGLLFAAAGAAMPMAVDQRARSLAHRVADAPGRGDA